MAKLGERYRGGGKKAGDAPKISAERGFCRLCGAWRGSIGLEPDYRAYIDHMVMVFAEVWRVLRKDGVVFLNLGDCYATGAGAVGERPGGGDQGDRWAGYMNGGTRGHRGTHLPKQSGKAAPRIEAMGPMTQPNRMPQRGLKAKDLVMMPHRVAIALQDWGWWVRSDIVWAKDNPMPESVRDRPTKSHEYIFLLAKSERYFYDAEAIKENCESGPSDIRKMEEGLDRIGGKHKTLDDPLARASAATNMGRKRSVGSPSGRNRRSVWTVNTSAFSAAHFATFPPSLVEPCILAGSSERGVCASCGAPWIRMTEKTAEPTGSFNGSAFDRGKTAARDGGDRTQPGARLDRRSVGWRASCACGAAVVPATILDPFAGAFTVSLVAERLRRDSVAIELNPQYVEMGRSRLRADASLLLQVEDHEAEPPRVSEVAQPGLFD